MSGERVEVIKRRAQAFLELGEELLHRNILDIASFNLHQACQLRIKASLLRLRGEIPRIHSLRELLGMITTTLDELGYSDQAENIRKFVRNYRGALIDLESMYVESRYGLTPPTKHIVENTLEVAKKLFNLLDRVESNVLG